MDCGQKWTEVENGRRRYMDVSGLRSFRHVSSTDLQPAKMYRAYSHAPLRRRRLTMLNPRLQPGGRHTLKLAPQRGATISAENMLLGWPLSMGDRLHFPKLQKSNKNA